MTASSTSRHRTDDTPCRVEAGASLARATRSAIHLARSIHPAYLMALRPQLRPARSSASRTARSIPEGPTDRVPRVTACTQIQSRGRHLSPAISQPLPDTGSHAATFNIDLRRERQAGPVPSSEWIGSSR